jgi:hypothetical protein
MEQQLAGRPFGAFGNYPFALNLDRDRALQERYRDDDAMRSPDAYEQTPQPSERSAGQIHAVTAM